jgi:glycosyltransferase involved in cell wall biosynthesis
MAAPAPNRSARAPAIVFLVPGFPRHESDSTCIPALQNYVLHFARSNPGLCTAVVSFQYPAPPSIYRWHGIEVHAAGGRNRRGPWRRLTWLRAAAAFRRIHRRADVVLVHSFWLGECTLIGQRLTTKFGAPHVASIMGQDARTTNSYVHRMDLDRMTITSGSEFAASHFEAATGRKVDHVVPFGLDVESFARPETNRDIEVLGVGSLTALKNYSLFVTLIAELRGEFPALRAALIGDGPERGRLREAVAERGLGANLQVHGELPRPRVIDQLFRSRILLHPSLYEGQGYVFLEALHAGLAVVCFGVGHRPPTPRAHVCRSAEEMAAQLRALLRERPPPERVAVETIEDTVAAFRVLYGF